MPVATVPCHIDCDSSLCRRRIIAVFDAHAAGCDELGRVVRRRVGTPQYTQMRVQYGVRQGFGGSLSVWNK